MIQRLLSERIESKLFQGKAILVSGTRQVGKTTLLKAMLEKYPGNILYLNGDDVTIQNLMNRPNTQQLKQIIGNNKIVFLEKAWIVFRLPPLSRNLRNEIKAKNKIYFYDNGIRNAVIRQFQALPIRQDIGILWENFLISERMKQISKEIPRNYYFWRTTQQQEVDYVEEVNGKFYGYEFKWNERKKIKFPLTFTKNYNALNLGINKTNFREFVILN